MESFMRVVHPFVFVCGGSVAETGDCRRGVGGFWDWGVVRCSWSGPVPLQRVTTPGRDDLFPERWKSVGFPLPGV